MKKEKLIFIGLLFLTIIGTNLCVENNIVYTNNNEKGMSYSNSIADSNDLQKFSGLVDYIFVGKVENVIGTFFNESLPEIPYTRYGIRVLKNLKGNLIEKTIVSKNGGYENNKLILFDDNGFPQKNEIYVFFAFAQEDGEILLATIDGNIKLDINDFNFSIDGTSNLKEEEKLYKYTNAIKNRKEYDRERYISKYEK
ncbi:MAG: hypothetical protein PHI05_01620 [Bacilli bacterium]|nr:hypothetical protein [Bacilli bacterium]MDD4547426.1 hypothetical protein [Bacilli bacterium]